MQRSTVSQSPQSVTFKALARPLPSAHDSMAASRVLFAILSIVNAGGSHVRTSLKNVWPRMPAKWGALHAGVPEC